MVKRLITLRTTDSTVGRTTENKKIQSKPKDGGLVDWYSYVPKKFTKKKHNPNYRKHLIDIEFRMLIIGPAGSGKTTTLMEIIHRMSRTFEKIIVCLKAKEEPLYLMLEEKCGDAIQFYENGEIPEIDPENEAQTLIIFDDLCLEKDQTQITEYFIRGRKKHYSCVYLTQSYFRCPKTIRINCDYIIFKKLSGKKDLSLILGEYALEIDLPLLQELYNDCMKKNRLAFFMLALGPQVPLEMRFRCCFKPIKIFN